MISALASGRFCLDRIFQGGESLCIHNPADRPGAFPCPHQSKTRLPTVAKNRYRRCGPRGLEAARVASAARHEVVVLEAANRAAGAPFDGAQQSDGPRDECRSSDLALHNAEAGGVDPAL